MFTGSLPPASNRADWSEVFELFDDETGDLLDLTDATITFEIRDGCWRLAATVVVITTGTFSASFTKDQFRNLCAGTYDAGCMVTINDTTTQEFIGTLPVLDGVVR